MSETIENKVIKPITPQEAREKEGSYIPQFVIESFNEAIIQNLRGKESTVIQKDVVAVIKEKMKGLKIKDFNSDWLNVEPLYKKEGWEVTYDKPGYNESYDASFCFKIKDK